MTDLLTASVEGREPEHANNSAIQFATEIGAFLGCRSILEVAWTSEQSARARRFDLASDAQAKCGEWEECGPQLPFESGEFPTTFTLGTIGFLEEARISSWLAELKRVTQNLWVGVEREAEGGRDRYWWESRLILSGFRKHPLASLIVPYERIDHEGGSVTLLFEKVPDSALEHYPHERLREHRDLHMDMLREAGRRSDAHIARYALAADHLPEGGTVLDAACGLGYGTSLLSRFGGSAVHVEGRDISQYAIDYARHNFEGGSAAIRFTQGDVTDLSACADNSVNLVVSFETIEHLRNPAAFLKEVRRVLKPGGTCIGSVPNQWLDETGRDPNPHHFHVFNLTRFYELMCESLDVQQVHAQIAGGGLKKVPLCRVMRPVRLPFTQDEESVEWWLIAAIKPRSASIQIQTSDIDTRPCLLTGNPGHPLYSSWTSRFPIPLRVVDPSQAGEGIPSGTTLLITHDTYVAPGRTLVRQAVNAGIPTLILADGILDFRNTFEHPQLDPGAVFQPVLGHKIATIGRAQSRILESWGNAGKCETVGLPRLDAYYAARRRRRSSGEPMKILISTARTPFFTQRQRWQAEASMRDLRTFFDSSEAWSEAFPEPVWRLTHGLAEQVGLSSHEEIECESLFRLLQEVDAVISTPSTVILEAMMLGLPTAVLDYGSTPAYLPTAWRITAPQQIPDVVAQLAHPSPAKLLFQETVLHDQCECASPAAPRLIELVMRMWETSLNCRNRGIPVRFEEQILEVHSSSAPVVENRFQFARISDLCAQSAGV